MLDKDIVYVLTSVVNGTVEMATTNDFKAWALYRDMPDVRISIFVSGNKVASVEPEKTRM